MQIDNYKDFFEIEDDSTDGEDIVEYDITASPRDLNPANIADWIDSGIIEIPLFQRNFVWDIQKSSKLVESLILGLPVPELFFFTEGDDDETFKIIDGQQRLLSIYFFFKGRFPKGSDSRIFVRSRIHSRELCDRLDDNDIFQDFVLKLEDEDRKKDDAPKRLNRYNGKKYKTLDKDTQIKFRLRRFLRAVVVRQNKPDNSNSSMFEIFNRLNTGGTPLNHQEIRASLYYCDFYEMMAELNNLDGWRNLLGRPVLDLRSNDLELILRSLALLQDEEIYAPKMVTFLNSYSQKSKRFKKEHIEYLKELFISFINACSELDGRAFFRNNRFSKTMFESIFVAVCKNSFKSQGLVTGKIDSDSFSQLKEDEAFTSYLMSGSASATNIKNRIQKASDIIKINEAD